MGHEVEHARNMRYGFDGVALDMFDFTLDHDKNLFGKSTEVSAYHNQMKMIDVADSSFLGKQMGTIRQSFIKHAQGAAQYLGEHYDSSSSLGQGISGFLTEKVKLF
ncbi:MAG: hypothetical protein ACI83O_000878 [Patescibacteria group bacterium]|jgi:hypothetical protein